MILNLFFLDLNTNKPFRYWLLCFSSMLTRIMLCLFPWDVTLGEEKGFVSNWGWDAGPGSRLPVHAAGLGHPHRTIFRADICDTALDRAGRVANSSSARTPAPRPNNFPGSLLITAARCSINRASAPSQPPSGTGRQLGSSEEFLSILWKGSIRG